MAQIKEMVINVKREYRIVDEPFWVSEKMLNDMGGDNWELVAIDQAFDCNSGQQIKRLIFARVVLNAAN